MIIEHIHNKIRYTLSNEGLKVGDNVYPIANGRTTDDGSWILHNLDYRDFTSGFPDEPHTILDLHHSDYKPYEVRTKQGFGPIEKYYRIIKREEQVDCRREGAMFSSWKWIIID